MYVCSPHVFLSRTPIPTLYSSLFSSSKIHSCSPPRMLVCACMKLLLHFLVYVLFNSYIHISDGWSTGVYSTCLHIICVTLMLKFISVMLMLKFLTINYCRVIYQWRSLCCNLFLYYVRRCNQSILMHCQSLAFSPVNASVSLKSIVTAVL